MARFARIAALAAGVWLAACPSALAEGYAGFRFGGTQASMTGDDSDQVPHKRRGFTGGAFVGFDAGSYVGFRGELLFTQKGGRNVNDEVKIDYFELAPLLVGRYAVTERYAVRVFAGPVVGLFVTAEAQTRLFDADGNSIDVDIDIGDIVEHWEVSGTIGAEFNAKAGPYVLLLEARYTQGSRVFEDIGLDGEPLDLKVSNSGIAVMTGLMIPF